MATGLPVRHHSTQYERSAFIILEEEIILWSQLAPYPGFGFALYNIAYKHVLGGGPNDVDDIKRHVFFANINWDDLYCKRVTPPFKPQVESETDTRYFDNVFTGESVQLTPPDTNAMETDDDDSPHFEQFSFHGSSQSLSNINASTRSLNSVHSLGLL